jgi:hypothetical protein
MTSARGLPVMRSVPSVATAARTDGPAAATGIAVDAATAASATAMEMVFRFIRNVPGPAIRFVETTAGRDRG